MINYEINKNKKIRDVVSVVKLFSLLFSSGVMFQDTFNFMYNPDNVEAIFVYVSAVVLSSLILSSIYILWIFFIKPKIKCRSLKYAVLIEDIAFILLFLINILSSGGHESQYKLIFLFVIITSTIEHEIKYGTAIAGVSSLIVLMLDIIQVQLPGRSVNIHFENDIVLSAVFFLTAWILGYYVKSEKEHIEGLKKLVNEDGLTRLYNHRYFHDVLKKTVKDSEENDKSISLIFIDIDNFKHYNDLYGHQKGDEVLKLTGEIIKKSIRDGDIAARYGGEEFAIIMPNTPEKDAVLAAETLRLMIQNTYFEGEENQPNGKITASIGLSTFPDKAKSDIDLIKSADDALYRAKFFNKNRIETYTSVLDELKKDIDKEDIDITTSIKTLISIINAKDRYTYGHVERVVIYCRLLADKLNLSEEDRKSLIYGAYMHDIGKIDISKDILNKRMPLEKDEWELLKQHPENGVAIVKTVEALSDVVPIILHHHEKYDGKGYPHGLKDQDIPYLARVLTVADSFDAMTSNRPYNKRKTYEEAVEELRKCSGTQFDPQIAEVFCEVILENSEKLDELA